LQREIVSCHIHKNCKYCTYFHSPVYIKCMFIWHFVVQLSFVLSLPSHVGTSVLAVSPSIFIYCNTEQLIFLSLIEQNTNCAYLKYFHVKKRWSSKVCQVRNSCCIFQIMSIDLFLVIRQYFSLLIWYIIAWFIH